MTCSGSITPIVNDKAAIRTQVSRLPKALQCAPYFLNGKLLGPSLDEVSKKGYIHFCFLEIVPSHTGTQLPVQKCSAEHEDAIWKVLLGLDSGVWPSSRWQCLRVPAACGVQRAWGRCRARTGSPLGLARLGGTTESRRWAGWARHTTHTGRMGHRTALRRSRAMGLEERGHTRRAEGMGNMGRVSLERCPPLCPPSE